MNNLLTKRGGAMFFQKRAGGGSVDVQPLTDVEGVTSSPKQLQQQQPPAPPTFMEEVTDVLSSFQYTPTTTTSTTTEIVPSSQDDIDGDGDEILAVTSVPKEDSEPLTLTSAIALVAGTTVGAGILALPAFTIKSGFFPSSLSLTGAWLYMVTTGLLIAEVNLNLAGKSHRPDGGLVSMARRTIGSTGAAATGAAYLFLHYALLVAYIAQGGEILTSGLEGLLGLLGVGAGEGVTVPSQLAPVLFTATLGGALAFGNKKWLDSANDVLVGVVVLTFVGLVGLAAPRANPAALLQADWGATLSSIPVMFVALVFHNIVPVISYRLKGDVDKIRTSVVVGSGIPLLMFLAWNAVVLGNIDSSVLTSSSSSSSSVPVDPLALLRAGGAGDGLGRLISVFSEVAIVTSFTGFVYGLKDFLKDVLFSRSLAKSGNRHLSHNQDMLAYSLILLPPLAVAVVSPGIFFSALDNAGAFGICVLFGIVPAAMASIVRWRSEGGGKAGMDNEEEYLRLVPGGNVVLAGVGVIAAFVIVQKAMQLLG